MKKLILVAIFIFGFAFTGFVNAEEDTNDRPEHRPGDVLQQIREDHAERRDEMMERKEDAIEHRSEMRENHMERRAERKEEIRDRIEELKENRSDRLAKLKDERKDKVVGLMRGVFEKLSNAANRLSSADTKISAKIESFNERGVDTSSAESALSAAQDSLASTLDEIEAVKSNLEAAVEDEISAEIVRELLGGARESIKATHDAYKEVFHELREAITEFKGDSDNNSDKDDEDVDEEENEDDEGEDSEE